MKEIWEDHHRQMKEIDLKYKSNMKRLFTIVGLILITIATAYYKYN
jgi:hypothetical protein